MAHAQPVVAGFTDDPGRLLVRRGAELVTCLRHRGQPEDLHGRRGTSGLHLLALVVDHRPHAAPCRAGDDRVADVELALVDEHCRHGPPTDVELGLEHDTLGPPVRVRPELLELGHHDQLVEQVVDAELLGRRHLDDDRVAAPRLRYELVLGELAEHALWVGVVLVDLVDSNDDRHLGRLGMVDRLDRLGHDTVVGGDDEHDDVRRVGAAGPHLRERGVTRRVEERDLLAVLLDLVGADVLGDATGLAGHDVGMTDLVQHGRLAVVDMAHDRDDRRARLLVLLVVAVVEEGLEADLLLLAGLDEHDVGADLQGEQLHLLVREVHRRGDHLAVVEQEADDVRRRAVQLRPELLGRDTALDDDRALRHRRVAARVVGVLRLQLLTVATTATAAATPWWAALPGRTAWAATGRTTGPARTARAGSPAGTRTCAAGVATTGTRATGADARAATAGARPARGTAGAGGGRAGAARRRGDRPARW